MNSYNILRTQAVLSVRALLTAQQPTYHLSKRSLGSASIKDALRFLNIDIDTPLKIGRIFDVAGIGLNDRIYRFRLSGGRFYNRLCVTLAYYTIK